MDSKDEPIKRCFMGFFFSALFIIHYLGVCKDVTDPYAAVVCIDKVRFKE
ncbi:MAG: hypothetical protein HY786_00670 [Deltaproteobacteria bacterium]|nr:hypothetical protein [Deltaproteobacteria bacterium]